MARLMEVLLVAKVSDVITEHVTGSKKARSRLDFCSERSSSRI
jgi:hypothetical protein